MDVLAIAGVCVAFVAIIGGNFLEGGQLTALLNTYQYLADTGKVERLAQLFAPDGVLDIGSEKFTGPDEVLGLFTRTGGQFVDADFLPARHHLSYR